MAEEQHKPLGNKVDENPTLLRGWNNDDDLISIAEPELENEATILRASKSDDREGLIISSEQETKVVPLKPGDHVIRWKILKALLWPIQIHGIVLSSDVDCDGVRSVVIADFGYSSTQDGKKKNGLRAINDRMRNFYDGKKEGDAPPTPTGIEQEAEEEEAEAEEGEKIDAKRFHIRTISDPKALKKWSKVNYGQSLFSSKGKLDKLKKLFKIPQKKKDDDDQSTFVDDESASMFDENDDFFKASSAGGGCLDTVVVKESKPKTPLAAIIEVFAPLTSPTRSKEKQKDIAYDNILNGDDVDDDASIDSIEQLVAQANEVERRTRPRSRGFLPGRQSRHSDDSSVSSFASMRSAASARSVRPIAELNNLFKKLSFQKNDKPEEHNTVSPDVSTGEQGKSGEGPKLPKSDPRAIVLARVKYILAEQDKPEDETGLPKYHILYSNSECLAVWCKTGKFSTLQAAVFLHSTSIANAKSSFLLGAGIAATQPWLIPVVGMYAVAAVGMPYYVLKKCKDRWKESELKLTTTFWAHAGPEVYVAAIENWSGLTPERQEDSDEIGPDAKVKATQEEPAPLIEQV